MNRRLFRFGTVEVDSARPGLVRDGTFVDLRQRTFQVLLYLLESRDRVVSREELMTALWGDVVVTEGSLNQCVVDIRRALDDDPRRPRYVKTFPKSGYQFVCPVEEAAPDALSPTVLEIESLEVEIEEEIPDPPAPPALRALPPAPVRRPWLPLAAALAGLAAGALLVRGATRPDVRLPATPGRTAVAVLFFENRSGSHELDWLREGLAEMLVTDLSRSRKLTLLSGQQLHVLLDRVGHRAAAPMDLETALEVGRRSRASALVLGAFQQIGARVRLDAQLLDAPTGRILSAENLVAERPEQLLTQVSLLATRLATRLGAPLDADQAPARPREMSTESLDAYRYYALGLEKARGLHNTEALALFEKAIALDPGFAMAHARIGFTLGVADNRAAEALPHLREAAARPDRLTPKGRLEVAGWTAIATYDFPGAIATYRRLVSEYPDDVEAYQRLGQLLQGEERLEAAVDVLRAGLTVDPDSSVLHNALSGIYADMGRHDDAIAEGERYVALDPKEPNAHDTLGLAYQWAGRYDEARAAYDRALSLDPDFMVALVHQGNLLAELGRYRDAIAAYRRIADTADTAWFRDRGWDSVATAQLWRGDLTASGAALANAASGAVRATPFFLAVSRRDTRSIRALAPALAAEAERFGRGARGNLRFTSYLSGRAALASGDVEAGLRELRLAVAHRPLRFNLDPLETCLADALLEMGRNREALDEYERVLRLNPRAPMALYRSAVALEAMGRGSDARERLRRFLEVWKAADADAPPLLDAKSRLGRAG